MKPHSMLNQYRSTIPGVLMLTAAVVLSVGCVNNLKLRQQGHDATFAGNLELADQKYAQAVEREPDDYRAQYHLGVTRLAMGRALEAQWALEYALRLVPDDEQWTPRILDQLAEALFQQDRPDKLEAFLAKTIDYYGQWGDFLRQAKYLAKIGDMDGAALAYRKAAYFAPPLTTSPYLAMADFYESINDVPNAMLALRYAYHVNSRQPQVAQRLRQFGIVPGPTVALTPPKLAEKP